MAKILLPLILNSITEKTVIVASFIYWLNIDIYEKKIFICTFKVALILAITTKVIGVNKTSFDTHHMLPPLFWIGDILSQMVIQLFKSHFCRLAGCVCTANFLKTTYNISSTLYIKKYFCGTGRVSLTRIYQNRILSLHLLWEKLKRSYLPHF